MLSLFDNEPRSPETPKNPRDQVRTALRIALRALRTKRRQMPAPNEPDDLNVLDEQQKQRHLDYKARWPSLLFHWNVLAIDFIRKV